MEGDSQRRGVRRTGIACQALRPAETPMSALGSREDDRRLSDNCCWCGTTCQANRFAADDLEPGSSEATARPVFPEHRCQRRSLSRGRQRRRSIREDGLQGPQHGAHPSRLEAGTGFLTLRSQGTAATVTDASSIQDPKRAITLGSALLWVEGTIRRATQRPIRLQAKSGTGKACGKRRACPLRRSILNWRWGVLRRDGFDGRSWLDGQRRRIGQGFGKFRRVQF